MRYGVVAIAVCLLVMQSVFAADLAAGKGKAIQFPLPSGLDKIANPDEHFDYLLDNLDKNPLYFNYLKARYMELPMMRPGFFPDVYPDPKSALMLLQKYSDNLAKKIFVEVKESAPAEKKVQDKKPGTAPVVPSLPETVGRRTTSKREISPTANKSDVEKWFLVKGAIACGKRAVNRTGDDGGEEFREIFSYSKYLSEHPQMFDAFVSNFIRLADRPFRSRSTTLIKYANKSVSAFLPEYLVYEKSFDSEAQLYRLYANILASGELKKIIVAIPEERYANSAVLSRVGVMLAKCHYKPNPEVKYFHPEISLPILQKLAMDAGFAVLSAEDQAAVNTAIFRMLLKDDDYTEALAFQQKLMDKGATGAYPLIKYYSKKAGELKKNIAKAERAKKHPKQYEKDIIGDAQLEELVKQREEIIAKRDELIQTALLDFEHRNEISSLAEHLYGIKHKWECYNYLRRFLEQNKIYDYPSLEAVLTLAKLYQKEAMLRAESKVEITVIVSPEIAKLAKDDAARIAAEQKDLSANYFVNAQEILKKINADNYKDTQNDKIRDALGAYKYFKEQLDAQTAKSLQK